MTIKTLINQAPIWLVVSLILLNNCWSLTVFDLKIYQYFHLGIILYFFYNIILHRKEHIPDCSHKIWIILLMCIPLLSVYSSYIILGRHIVDSLIVCRMHLGFLLYFVLWYRQVSLKQLISVIIILGMGYALLTIIQQITYPMAPFGMRTLGSGYVLSHSGTIERRLGFYRFEIMGVYFASIVAVLWMAKRVQLNKYMVAILLLSLFASGNRRVIGVSAIALGLCWSFNSRNKHKYIYAFISILILILVYTFRFEIFGNLANWEEDLADGRSHSYLYFLELSTSNPLGFLFGYGLGRIGDGVVDSGAISWVDGKPVILADIGAVACLYYWGIFYVITLFGLFISLVVNKFLAFEYKSILIGFLCFLWILFLSWEINGSSFIAILAYLCDLSIYKNKIKRTSHYNAYRIRRR